MTAPSDREIYAEAERLRRTQRMTYQPPVTGWGRMVCLVGTHRSGVIMRQSANHGHRLLGRNRLQNRAASSA